MPADFEMLVSHSPPVYSSYLTDYVPSRRNRDCINNFSTGMCRSVSSNSFLFSQKPQFNASKTPPRPCLVIRSEENYTNDEESTSPTRLKKKVVFADDRGMSLTHVRVMTEPSNVPPLLNSRFLSEVTRGLTAEPLAKVDPWEITFAQPASNYLEFRRKLELDKVSLENVIVKDSENCASGTIKVSNISFEKEVIVRSSSDNWKTHQDNFCTFVDNGTTKSVTVAYTLFDTFSFKLTLPPKERKLEFCICYKSGGEEFWDNNNNQNFILIKKSDQDNVDKVLLAHDMNLKNSNTHKDFSKTVIRYSDATRAKVDAWSEFASWNHLENSNPYW